MLKSDLQRFQLVDFTSLCKCLKSHPPAIVDKVTNKIIVECMNEETAEMVCKALNLAQNEGLL
jgi:hypothetical protein